MTFRDELIRWMGAVPLENLGTSRRADPTALADAALARFRSRSEVWLDPDVLAKTFHENYFAHTWESEDGASRACMLQAIAAVRAAILERLR